MAQPIALLDSTTGGGGTTVQKTSPLEDGVLYVSGLSSDTIKVKWRPRTGDSFERIHSDLNLSSSSDPVQPIFPLPAGTFKVTRNGTSDTLTVLIVPIGP